MNKDPWYYVFEALTVIYLVLMFLNYCENHHVF
nr:MAG TPA: hypothetical protein [Caudoviricetes sp.]DAH94586.1 MAG TPA: hypothetical protein [Caudoviricetes sp.]